MIDTRIAVIVCRSEVGRISENLARMRRWIRRAASAGARMVCFPELNLTGYTIDSDALSTALKIPGPETDAISEMAVENDLTILFGAAEKGPESKVFASHVSAGPDGKTSAYRKLHISPPEQDMFSPGDCVPIFREQGLTYGIQLCYDAHFPELTTRIALKGADAVFIPHASPQGTPREKYASWMRHLTARAFDNGMFVVAWNQTGKNAQGMHFPGLAVVIGPDGKMIDRLLTETDQMLVTTLHAESLHEVRSHRMRYFLPNRRIDLFGGSKDFSFT